MKRSVTKLLLPSKSSGISSFSKSLLFQNINSVDDFYILLDNPHKTFRPGDYVTGGVIIKVKKHLVNILVLLLINGVIKISSNTITKKKRLFLIAINLYGEADGTGLLKGEHRFPFSIKLPRKNIYSSISFEKGSILYSLKSHIYNKTAPDKSKTKSETGSDSTFEEDYAKYDSISKCEKNLTIECPINVARFKASKPSLLIIKSPQKKFLKNLSSLSTINSEVSTNSAGSEASSGNSPDDVDSNSSILNNISGSLFKSSGIFVNHSNIRLLVNTPSIAYLPNDLVPIEIHLRHIKNVKSLNGIIITLIRVCKIDNSPDGSVQSFRKDLSQVVKPLYVDPSTLELQIKTNIKIPYNVFSTIRGAPLVGFEYYLEVLANLSNKTPGQTKIEESQNKDKFKKFRKNEDRVESEEKENEGILNVDKLKRLKNVISLTRKIIVGTERVNILTNGFPDDSRFDSTNSVQPIVQSPIGSYRTTPDNDIMEEVIPPPVVRDVVHQTESEPSGFSRDDLPPPPSLPLIHDFHESNLSEKELLRIHEESLLPSAPPGSEGAASAPSVPTLEPNEAVSVPSYNQVASDFSPSAPPPPPVLDAGHLINAGNQSSFNRLSINDHGNVADNQSNGTLQEMEPTTVNDVIVDEVIDFVPKYEELNEQNDVETLGK